MLNERISTSPKSSSNWYYFEDVKFHELRPLNNVISNWWLLRGSWLAPGLRVVKFKPYAGHRTYLNKLKQNKIKSDNINIRLFKQATNINLKISEVTCITDIYWASTGARQHAKYFTSINTLNSYDYKFGTIIYLLHIRMTLREGNLQIKDYIADRWQN